MNTVSGNDSYNARAAIYRGQEIFNARQFIVSGGGVNDKLNTPELTATWAVCQYIDRPSEN